jgi:hypothetical protein
MAAVDLPWFSYETLWFSIAMLAYQRVTSQTIMGIWGKKTWLFHSADFIELTGNWYDLVWCHMDDHLSLVCNLLIWYTDTDAGNWAQRDRFPHAYSGTERLRDPSILGGIEIWGPCRSISRRWSAKINALKWRLRSNRRIQLESVSIRAWIPFTVMFESCLHRDPLRVLRTYIFPPAAHAQLHANLTHRFLIHMISQVQYRPGVIVSVMSNISNHYIIRRTWLRYIEMCFKSSSRRFRSQKF